ncbi:MAG: hypothetical protein UFG06_13990 [Lachnospiraceae bacterium]|nr:hypothetical protein [Lachnospiraceae bacterium]
MDKEQIKKRNQRQYTWQKDNTDRLNFTMPKGTKDRILQAAGKGNASDWMREAIFDKLNGAHESGAQNHIDIPDLAAYARSAGMTEDEYIKTAVEEKMKRQDAEYTETVTREKLDF